MLGCDVPEGEGLPPVLGEEVVLDLKAAFDEGRARVLAQDEDWPLATWPAAWLDREEALGTLASDETATVLHARAESAFEVDTPVLGPGARFQARTFVYPVDRIDPTKADPSPVTFRVLVDGQERASLSSAYVREMDREHPFDRLMRTMEVDLSEHEGRSVTLRLETTRGGAPRPDVMAEPSWWHLSVSQLRQVPRQRASPARPHLLVICVDTLAARRLSAWGYPRPTSPNLDAWAAEGSRFTHATSSSSWTLPATASLFTGLAPNTHGVLGDARSYLMEALDTWAEGLARQGMAGAAFVANPLLAQANNFHQGFDLWVNDDGLGEAGSADARDMVDQLLGWVDGQPQDGRWFAYLHLMDPHAPYGAPGEARDRFVTGPEPERDLSGHLPRRLQSGEDPPLEPAEQDHVVALYEGEVAYLDAELQRLREALAARGLDDRTVVLLTADHGEELFELGRLGHGYALNEPMLHVPLVLVGAGVPAAVIDTPVSTASVCNTLLRLAGAEPVPGGAPALLPAKDTDRPVFALTRTHLFGPRRILVSARDAGGRKVVVELSGEGPGEEAPQPVAVDRFDLTGSLGEATAVDLESLPDEERAAFERLEAAAVVWYSATAAARPGDVQHLADIDEQLRKVGYTGGDDDDG